jgi:hypothetical protein
MRLTTAICGHRPIEVKTPPEKRQSLPADHCKVRWGGGNEGREQSGGGLLTFLIDLD